MLINIKRTFIVITIWYFFIATALFQVLQEKFGKSSFLSEQFFVRSSFSDLTILEHNNLIHLRQESDSMCN